MRTHSNQINKQNSTSESTLFIRSCKSYHFFCYFKKRFTFFLSSVKILVLEKIMVETQLDNETKLRTCDCSSLLSIALQWGQWVRRSWVRSLCNMSYEWPTRRNLSSQLNFIPISKMQTIKKSSLMFISYNNVLICNWTVKSQSL